MLIGLLDQTIKYVCPIDGVSVGNPKDKSTWRIDFKDEATKAEKDAAQVILGGWDINKTDYREDRRKAYPPVEDYLDAWVKEDVAALNKYKKDCLAVKTKYPKV